MSFIVWIVLGGLVGYFYGKKKLGYSAKTHHNGNAAVGILGAYFFGILLTVLNLADLNGFSIGAILAGVMGPVAFVFIKNKILL